MKEKRKILNSLNRLVEVEIQKDYWVLLDQLKVDGNNVENFIKHCDKARIEKGIPETGLSEALEHWVYALYTQLKEDNQFGVALYLWASSTMDKDDPWLMKFWKD